MTGFRYDENTLAQAAGWMHSGAEHLDRGAEPPDAVDAGFSSDLANAALARIARANVVLAQAMDDIGGKVNATKGIYDNIENSAKGEVQYREKYLHPTDRGEAPLSDRHRDSERERAAYPLERAPGDPSAKYNPDPTPSPPGRTPEPPPTTGHTR